MRKQQRQLTICVALFLLMVSSAGAKDRQTSEKPPSLWSYPASISSRDLYYGQGGRQHQPKAEPFVFVEEDKDGNSPKFVVRDGQGVKWKVKVGPEARPETVATRLVWAVGYSTDEDYFLTAQTVVDMPRKLSRGDQFVDSDGVVHNARWERMTDTKAGIWKWSKNPFRNTRELNGLRVLMALVNNWDMKDPQNTVLEDSSKQQYIVGDLGATLGPTGSRWPLKTPRGDLERYRRADFIKKIRKDSVDFATPSWPMLLGVLPLPPFPYARLTGALGFLGVPKLSTGIDQRWIGKQVPREDVRWIAGLLSQLTPRQIRSAFRAAHYTPEEVEGFSRVVEARIAALNAL